VWSACAQIVRAPSLIVSGTSASAVVLSEQVPPIVVSAVAAHGIAAV
jgi:hypothetical protein